MPVLAKTFCTSTLPPRCLVRRCLARPVITRLCTLISLFRLEKQEGVITGILIVLCQYSGTRIRWYTDVLQSCLPLVYCPNTVYRDSCCRRLHLFNRSTSRMRVRTISSDSLTLVSNSWSVVNPRIALKICRGFMVVTR